MKHFHWEMMQDDTKSTGLCRIWAATAANVRQFGSFLLLLVPNSHLYIQNHTVSHDCMCRFSGMCVHKNALTDYIEPDRSGRLGDGYDSHRLGHGCRLWHREVVRPLSEQQWQGWRDGFANPLYMEFDCRPQWGITAVLRFYLSGGAILRNQSDCWLTQKTADQSV